MNPNQPPGGLPQYPQGSIPQQPYQPGQMPPFYPQNMYSQQQMGQMGMTPQHMTQYPHMQRFPQQPQYQQQMEHQMAMNQGYPGMPSHQPTMPNFSHSIKREEPGWGQEGGHSSMSAQAQMARHPGYGGMHHPLHPQYPGVPQMHMGNEHQGGNDGNMMNPGGHSLLQQHLSSGSNPMPSQQFHPGSQLQALLQQRDNQQQHQQAQQLNQQQQQSYASASSTHSITSQKGPREDVVTPKIVAPEIADDFDSLCVGELCTLGRELVGELTFKTSQLSQILKKVMEKKGLQSGEDPTVLAEQCKKNLDKLVEIRLIIENRRKPGWVRMTGDDYIALMADSDEEDEMPEVKKSDNLAKRTSIITSKTPPEEGMVKYQGRWIPEDLHKKYLQFDANRKTLIDLNNHLKRMTWKTDVSSPSHLKKVDQTTISKKNKD